VRFTTFNGSRDIQHNSYLRLERLESRDVLSFLTPVSYPAGTDSLGVTVADLNHDGRRDVAYANSNVCNRFGDGSGALGASVCYDTAAYSNDVRAGDVNADGSPDLVVGTFGTVEVLLNHGDGTFGPSSQLPAGGQPFHVTVNEFNGDGKLDIAASNFNGGLQVLLGNGDGTFQSAVFYAGGLTANDVESADLDGDGWNDLTVDSGLSKYVSVFMNRGDGTFKPKTD
jgi:hypothetical protein